jgi:hypothetical protein
MSYMPFCVCCAVGAVVPFIMPTAPVANSTMHHAGMMRDQCQVSPLHGMDQLHAVRTSGLAAADLWLLLISGQREY